MKKLLALTALVFIILATPTVLASDQQTFIPLGGDEQCVFGYVFGDEQVDFYEDYSGSSPDPGESGGGGGGGGEVTCLSKGYYCCESCVEGTNQSKYNSTCTNSKVCCSLCEEDIIVDKEKEKKGGIYDIVPESLKNKYDLSENQWLLVLIFGVLGILLILFFLFSKKRRY